MNADISWIHPKIAVSGRIPTAQFPSLSGMLKIRRVIDLRSEQKDDEVLLAAAGIALLHLPTPDLQPVPQSMLSTGVRWILNAIECQEKTLVHCEHGIGRSALLACCALVALGDPPLEALRRAKIARSKVSPTPEQLHAYIEWTSRSAEARTSRSSKVNAVTWDALAEIAYRYQYASEQGP